MSAKYSPEQLQQMARLAIQARDAGDPRFMQLVVTVALRLEMHPQQVANEIQRLAT